VAELRSLPAAEAEIQRDRPLARLDIQIRLAEGDLERALLVAGTVPGLRGSDPRYLWPLLADAMLACADAAVTGFPGRTGAFTTLREALVQVAASTAQRGPVERAHAAVFAAEAARASGRS